MDVEMAVDDGRGQPRMKRQRVTAKEMDEQMEEVDRNLDGSVGDREEGIRGEEGEGMDDDEEEVVEEERDQRGEARGEEEEEEEEGEVENKKLQVKVKLEKEGLSERWAAVKKEDVEEINVKQEEEEEVEEDDDDNEESRGPPASYEFEVAPAPPVRLSGIGTLWSNPITQAGAFRRTEYDPQLARATIPSSWMKDDDADDESTINVRGMVYRIPKPFDEDEACKAVERDLERAEMKFRSVRRERTVGGEIGSVIVKRKPPPKVKKPPVVVEPPAPKAEKQSTQKPLRPGLRIPNKKKNYRDINKEKQKEAEALAKAKEKQRRLEALAAARSKREMDKKWKPIWRSIAKTDIPKAARQLTTSIGANTKQCRSVAIACSKEVRRRALKLVKSGDDASRRSRRLLKDVMAYWRREEKERAEQRKRLTIELENQRKKDDEEREAQRQKNKLKFLLGQSEAFSSFLHKKDQATAEQTDKTFDQIDGTETDADIQRVAEAGAAALVKEHRARIEKFDQQTKEKREKINGLGNGGSDADVTDQGGKRATVAITQPTILIGKMKEYQLRGLSWLVSLYDQGINGMLADEMGLGKTIQTISFLAYLSEKENNWGPFLVVTPKATLHNWQQEINKFCPSFRVLPYWGTKNDRQELRKHWSTKRMYHREAEFHVCITSYEILRTDERHFPRVKWQYLVLDEAQAIKNSSSSRWKTLLNFPCRNRLLLTGTPLQNKMSELWSLLHFIMPSIFDSHTEFSDWFAKDIEGYAKNNSMLDSQTVKRLRILLDPFMLRRVKRDVENEMPPKTEMELPCELTPRQRILYAAIKSNISVEELIRSIGGSGEKNTEERGQLMNIVMELRKVCNHPETFERRHAGTPYQFQSQPPPPHLPLPPSILNTGTTQPAIEVTLVTRSAIPFNLPRLVEDFEGENRKMNEYLRAKLTIWEPVRVKEAMLGGALSPVRLCGISFQEMYRIMTIWDTLWCWWFLILAETEKMQRRYTVYGEVGAPRLLLDNVAKKSVTRSIMLLPGRESPIQLAEVSTRLLRSARVFIPAAAAPHMKPFTAGSTALSRMNREMERFFYPRLPTIESSLTVDDWYAFWRGLFGEYGRYIDSHPISLPDAGRLVADSGKMKLLDGLLKKLKEGGHKCLVYSQFTKVLDILEDYCAMASYKFLRLDGQSALADRRDMVADWQTNDELFVFLLSTRAGGVGINLTAADTVVFYDSDWNPTMDAQAMDRAHRLGQERPVSVYRLVSRGTIEERIRMRARQKDRINDLVIRGGSVEAAEEDNDREPELSDVATLLLGEEDINLKAMLAGGEQVKKTIDTEEALRARILKENSEKNPNN